MVLPWCGVWLTIKSLNWIWLTMIMWKMDLVDNDNVMVWPCCLQHAWGMMNNENSKIKTMWMTCEKLNDKSPPLP